jgi:uroporphyrinogen-III synthase
MRVLVTRPADDADETAAQLAARGHSSVIAPLLNIGFHDGPPLSLDGIQAIVATSSNGVRAFALRSARRDLPLFAVGAHTASVGAALGFTTVKSADGDAHALAAAIPTWTSPGRGALYHPAGSERLGPLATDLNRHGYEVITAELYRAEPVHELPGPAREAMKSGALDAVLLFSPRTARTFADCVAGAQLAEHCRTIIAFCISDATATALNSLRFQEIRTAGRPDQQSLLDLVR